MEQTINKANELFRNFKLDESREVLEKLIEQEPENLGALVLLGKIHSRTQNYGDAINFFNRVLDKNPDHSEAITGLQLIKNILQLTNNFYYENAYTDDDLYDFE